MPKCKNTKRIPPPLRSDGSVARKPVRHKPLPLDVTAFSEGVRKVFWDRVERGREHECWNWKGALTHDGYGRFGFKRKTRLAHRVAFRMQVGEIPDGLCVCHRCDNPKCVNPSHLWLGTNWDNTLDSLHKGRHAIQSRSSWAAKHKKNALRGDDHPFRKDPTLHCFGEGVNTAKLNASQVIRIRKLHASGKFGPKSLACRFGVSVSNIDFIISGKTWKHLLPKP